jgi:hypothetical protein
MKTMSMILTSPREYAALGSDTGSATVKKRRRQMELQFMPGKPKRGVLIVVNASTPIGLSTPNR